MDGSHGLFPLSYRCKRHFDPTVQMDVIFVKFGRAAQFTELPSGNTDLAQLSSIGPAEEAAESTQTTSDWHEVPALPRVLRPRREDCEMAPQRGYWGSCPNLCCGAKQGRPDENEDEDNQQDATDAHGVLQQVDLCCDCCVPGPAMMTRRSLPARLSGGQPIGTRCGALKASQFSAGAR